MPGCHCAAIVHVVFYCWSASAQCLRSSGGGSAYCWSAVSLSAFSVNVSWVVLLLVDGVTLRFPRVPSSVCVASGGVLELAYWLRSVEARDLAACHGATVSSQAGPRAWHGGTQPSASPTHGSRLDLTLGMEALPEARQDRHRTATAMVVWGRCQQCSVTQACRSVLAEQPIGSVVASQACHGVMLASVLVVVCSLA